MLSDPELAALIQQAARNLKTLELLVCSAGQDDSATFAELRRRLHDLQRAYIRETDALTQEALKREVERRTCEERRGRGPQALDSPANAH